MPALLLPPGLRNKEESNMKEYFSPSAIFYTVSVADAITVSLTSYGFSEDGEGDSLEWIG